MILSHKVLLLLSIYFITCQKSKSTPMYIIAPVAESFKNSSKGASVEKTNLLQWSTKKIKQRGMEFNANNEKPIVYGVHFIHVTENLGQNPPPSYMEALLGKGKDDKA